MIGYGTFVRHVRDAVLYEVGECDAAYPPYNRHRFTPSKLLLLDSNSDGAHHVETSDNSINGFDFCYIQFK